MKALFRIILIVLVRPVFSQSTLKGVVKVLFKNDFTELQLS
ncbi:MAG: hypothetical protein O2937_01500 [Bacteroidetes bacterium]|nr:hypothetical protein [Bacteroidota bacterium]